MAQVFPQHLPAPWLAWPPYTHKTTDFSGTARGSHQHRNRSKHGYHTSVNFSLRYLYLVPLDGNHTTLIVTIACCPRAAGYFIAC